ncbi:hypothetical protein Tco_1119183 [Tanacetum coccineum]
MDVPPRPSNPILLQSHPYLDITLSLSPITPLDHILDTPLPQPPPQPPLMGHPIYFNTFDYHGVNIELPGDLKEIPTKLENFTSTFKSLTTQVAELKTLHLLNRVTEALNKFAQVIESASTKAGDKVPQRAPLNLRGSISRKTREKRKDVKEECSESDSDDTIHLTGSMVEPSKKKKWKKFDFITEGGDHVYLIKEQIKEQKRIKESAKAEAAKHEVKVRREDLVDLLAPDVVSNCYKSKL